MVPAHFLNKLLVILPFTSPFKGPVNNEQNSGPWNYDDPNGDWGSVNSQCNGNRQSGIALSSFTSVNAPIAPLKFANYDVPLELPVIISNDGKSVSLNVDITQNGGTPYITGGLLRGRYEAVNVHFHWGSSNSKGSEHSIDGRFFDLEMHIVHKNSRYSTVEEAIRYKDGLSVLGIMFKIANDQDRVYPGLEKIYEKIPLITNYLDSATLDGSITLGQLLGDINVKKFYTYSGSLTTPPCSETVTWNVFPDPLTISQANANRFFELLDSRNLPLINNFRPLQPRNGRTVYYRRIGFLG